jgi:hypothetical protein
MTAMEVTMKERLKGMLIAFSKEIQVAAACNQCYFDISYSNGRNSEWEKVYRIAPAFFSLARKGLQTEAFLSISRMYEAEGRADYNLYKLLSFIEGNSKLIAGEKNIELIRIIEELKKGLDNRQQVADKLLYFRDKVIAHNGKEHFLEIQGKNYPDGLSFEEIVELIDYAGTLVNKVSSYVFGHTTHMKLINGWLNNGHDVDQLMDFCLKHLKVSH